MTSPTVDLLILGAGPAGCSAAIRARSAGLRVLIIEGSPAPRVAPGETLHPGIEPILDQLGVRQAVLAEGFHRHRGVWVEWDGPRRFEAYGQDERGPWLGFQADRQRFHRLLEKAAEDAGVEWLRPASPTALLQQNGRVVGVVVNGSEIFARWTADATGRRSWLAKGLKLVEQRDSPQLHVRFGWNTDDDLSELDDQPLFQAHPQGWDWTAPLGERRSAWATLRVANASEPAPSHKDGGLDLAWRIHRECAGPGYFLLGDAAAVLDPSSSHGTLRALMSGILCAHLLGGSVANGLPEPIAAQEYRNWLHQQYDHDVEALRSLYATHPHAVSLSPVDHPNVST